MKIWIKYLIGIDEVGRGPIAGPVAVCAFAVLMKNKKYLARNFRGAKDSKQLSENVRERIFKEAKAAKIEGQVFFNVAFCSEKVIDKEGIAPAIRRALRSALRALAFHPDDCFVLLDGALKAPKEFKNQRTIIRGDQSEQIISLASVVAKVTRDRRMKNLSKSFPNYGFYKHKGYGTKEHYKAIKKYGLCPLHRRSFLKGLI